MILVPAMTAGLCFAMAAPSLYADEWNQRTNFTFNEPVEVPGHVLNPGTYVFKLANTQGDRDVVQIYTKNMKSMVGTFLTVPDYRLRTPSKTIMTFEERAAGSPEAVKAWFYPGDNYGHEFVYPKTEAMKLAKANNQPVPYMEDQEYNSPSMNSGHIRVLRPTGETVEVIEIFGSGPQTNTGAGQRGNRSSNPGQSYNGNAGNSSGQSNTGNQNNPR
jgi:hypothetical protein